MEETKMKTRNGTIAACAVLALVVLASVGAVAAAQTGSQENIEVGTEDTGDIGILVVRELGTMYTDGDADTARVITNGRITIPAGYNTFKAKYYHSNDEPLDGQGAIYRLTVYDTRSMAHTNQTKVDYATSGTIEVSFDSQGTGEGYYELWCETHDWFDTEKASDIGTDYLDYI